ncbi:MlaD family protein [Amycolatopsis sp.]|uniref:MCE family protein n=1 Tax=Amycolatopsis sp. TaxID=37632 RepID=UPI002602AAB9|nr:MlaD family protein [Amycolatopsis sp.]
MSMYSDPSGRGPRPITLAVRGICYLAVLAVAVTLLLMQSRGDFTDVFQATAVVSDVGDGLPTGSDVKMRGVLVGSVGSVDSQAGTAHHVLGLNLKPEYANEIPASVKARIIPTNIFGSPSVDLVPAPGDVSSLASGAVIPGDDSTEALQLQTAMTKLKDILTAVEPAKLDAALSGIAQALSGRGTQLNSMIGRLDDYLGTLNPHAATFSHDVSSLASALDTIQSTAPALLDTVDSALTTTKTIVDKQQQLAASLAGGATAVDTVNGFLSGNVNRVISITKELRPVVHVVAGQSAQIPLSFKALGSGAAALAEAFPGPSHKLTIDLVVSLSPFSPYTAADCPRYPGLAGPNCGNPVPHNDTDPPPLPPPAPAPTPEQAPAPAPDVPAPVVQGGTVGPVGSQSEIDQLNALIGGNSSGSLADLLLGPILRGMTVVVPK